MQDTGDSERNRRLGVEPMGRELERLPGRRRAAAQAVGRGRQFGVNGQKAANLSKNHFIHLAGSAHPGPPALPFLIRVPMGTQTWAEHSTGSSRVAWASRTSCS